MTSLPVRSNRNDDITVAVHGGGDPRRATGVRDGAVEALRSGSYDAVVGNPPYITVKDKALNQLYRRLYPATTKGSYALSAPFLERFFDLARPESATTPAGWTGQITANSFMKREFGTPVVEKYLPT